jgi:hypothetical protein
VEVHRAHGDRRLVLAASRNMAVVPLCG